MTPSGEPLPSRQGQLTPLLSRPEHVLPGRAYVGDLGHRGDGFTPLDPAGPCPACWQLQLLLPHVWSTGALRVSALRLQRMCGCVWHTKIRNLKRGGLANAALLIPVVPALRCQHMRVRALRRGHIFTASLRPHGHASRPLHPPCRSPASESETDTGSTDR